MSCLFKCWHLQPGLKTAVSNCTTCAFHILSQILHKRITQNEWNEAFWIVQHVFFFVVEDVPCASFGLSSVSPQSGTLPSGRLYYGAPEKGRTTGARTSDLLDSDVWSWIEMQAWNHLIFQMASNGCGTLWLWFQNHSSPKAGFPRGCKYQTMIVASYIVLHTGLSPSS